MSDRFSSEALNHKNVDSKTPIPWFTKFCSAEMSHNYYVYHILNQNLEENRQIEAVFELGTGYGAMSMCLGLLGIHYDIPIFTYDLCEHISPSVKRTFFHLGIKFYQKDLFNPVNHQEISEKMGRFNNIYLICDNGNKRQEFADYIRYLKPNSLISVHDYGLEFTAQDASKYNNIEPFHEEEWMKHNTQFSTWKIK